MMSDYRIGPKLLSVFLFFLGTTLICVGLYYENPVATASTETLSSQEGRESSELTQQNSNTKPSKKQLWAVTTSKGIGERFKDLARECERDYDCECERGIDGLFEQLDEFYRGDAEPEDPGVTILFSRLWVQAIYQDMLGLTHEEGRRWLSSESELEIKHRLVEYYEILVAESHEIRMLEKGELEGPPATVAGIAWLAKEGESDAQKRISNFVRGMHARELLDVAVFFVQQDLNLAESE